MTNRATLARGTLIREVAAIAVEKGRAQLRRVSYTGKATVPNIEPLSAWVPVATLNLAGAVFYVRRANAFADDGNESASMAALIAARRLFVDAADANGEKQ